MSPYPTVVMVTTAHQNASGIDLKKDISAPASAKYTADENRTTPVIIRSRNMKIVLFDSVGFFFGKQKLNNKKT